MSTTDTNATATATVQLVNPWTGACPPDMVMSWADILVWCRENVPGLSVPEWRREARAAFQRRDGKALGRMIIGS